MKKRSFLKKIMAYVLVIAMLLPIMPTFESLGADILTDIPTFGSGTKEGPYDVGGNNRQYIYKGVDSGTVNDKISTFVSNLSSAGFSVKAESTIGSNLFKTFVGNKGAVYFSYFPYTNAVSIVTDTLQETVYKESEPTYTKVTDTTLSVLSLDYSHGGAVDANTTDANGESFVITLEDGRYVIIDGGWSYDAANLYRFLKDNNKRSDGKVHIAAWILSHSHEDHYGCFKKFASSYGNRVKVDYVVATPGASEMYANGYESVLGTELLSIASSVYLCDIIRPHTGNTLKFCNTEFQILYTGEDYAITNGYGTLTSENNASLVMMMKTNGQKVLFTQDADKQVSTILSNAYGNELKCDILQVNHHGASGLTEALRTYANPSYSLWPTNQASFDTRVQASFSESNAALYALGADKCFVADGSIEMIRLPLTNVSTDVTYYRYGSGDDDLVLFENDFNSPEISGLTDDALAAALFGWGNYRFGGTGDGKATMKIENGKLRIVGDDNDGTVAPTRSQFLLASDERVKEQGIIIECDYTLNEGSKNFFNFLGKPLVMDGRGVEDGTYWITGVWGATENGLRTGLRDTVGGKGWKIKQLKSPEYTTIGTDYHLKAEISPETGVTMGIGRAGSGTYDVALQYSIADIKAQGFTFEQIADANVRMMVCALADVCIDNLKVSLIEEENLDENVLYHNDFDSITVGALTNDALAAALFGEGKYRFGGTGDGKATMKIENGKLRIVGDNNAAGAPTRSQFLLAQDERVKEQGVIIECDYTLNTGSKNFFNFLGKPLVMSGNSVEAGTYWITGVWGETENGLRTGFRDVAGNKGWKIKQTTSAQKGQFTTIGTEYRLRAVISPETGVTMSIGKAGTETYDIALRYTIAEMKAQGFAFESLVDANVRMMVCALADVSIDNLNVSLLPKEEAGDVLFYNDFESAAISALTDDALATELFGEGKYRFGGTGDGKATMKIEGGKLRIVGDDDAAGAPTRSQFLLAQDERVTEQGVVIECDYTLNTGSQNFFNFLGKPLVMSGNSVEAGTYWITGVWGATENGLRTGLRDVAGGKGWKIKQLKSPESTIIGTAYHLKAEISPETGVTMSIGKAGSGKYDVTAQYTIAEIESAGFTFDQIVDANVRMMVCALADVSLDYLKVSLINYETLYSNDFEDPSLVGLSSEETAKLLCIENGYYFSADTSGNKAVLGVNGGALTIDSTGKEINDPDQFVLVKDEDISKYGVVVTCDYMFDSAASSGRYFTFASREVLANNYANSDNIWMAGLWYNEGYRASLRTKSSGWTAPGYVNQSDKTYSQAGVRYRVKVEVSPVNGLTLSAKKMGDSQYTQLARITMTMINNAGVSLSTYLDNYVKILVQGKSKVTIDNLEVRSLHAHDYTTGGICKGCGAFEDELAGFYSASISLDGNIGMNFYMDLSDTVVADTKAYVKFTVPDSKGGTKTETVKVSEAVTRVLNGKTHYKFTCEVAAKEMTDVVKLQLFTTTAGTGKEFTYSVKQYADSALKNQEQTAEAKALIKAMLNYGAYAQTYFDYNTNKLANADLAPEDQAITGSGNYDAYKYTMSGTLPTGVTIYSATLVVESETTIKCRFRVAQGVDVSSLTLSEGWSPLTADGSYYYTEYKNIAANELATSKQLTVSDETNSWTLDYSALSYVQQVHSNANASEAKKNITTALYDYYQAANTYFASVSNQ